MEAEAVLTLEGMDTLVALADDMAISLEAQQAALAHLMHGESADLRKRLRLLMLLANEAEVRQEDAEALTDVASGEVAALDHLGVLTRNRGRLRLTSKGENLLTFLLFFRMKMDGAMSEGFAQVVAAATAGGLDPTLMGRILRGSAERYARTLKESAASGSIIEASKHHDTRKRGSEHVRHILAFLGGHVDAHTKAELESAAVELHSAYIDQDASVVQMHRENIELPHGVTHRDLIESLRGHSPQALASLIWENAVLWQRPFVQPILQFDGDVSDRFKVRNEQEQVVEPIKIEAAEDGAVSLRRNWQRLKDSIHDAPDGSALHEVAVDVHAYLSGVYHALRGRLPRRLELPGVLLEIQDQRIQNDHIEDGPLILIRRTS